MKGTRIGDRSTDIVYHRNAEIAHCEFTPYHKLDRLKDIRNKLQSRQLRLKLHDDFVSWYRDEQRKEGE